MVYLSAIIETFRVGLVGWRHWINLSCARNQWKAGMTRLVRSGPRLHSKNEANERKRRTAFLIVSKNLGLPCSTSKTAGMEKLKKVHEKHVSYFFFLIGIFVVPSRRDAVEGFENVMTQSKTVKRWNGPVCMEAGIHTRVHVYTYIYIYVLQFRDSLSRQLALHPTPLSLLGSSVAPTQLTLSRGVAACFLAKCHTTEVCYVASCCQLLFACR
jgi:hypothetical protein